jgi:hypothetical protein
MIKNEGQQQVSTGVVFHLAAYYLSKYEAKAGRSNKYMIIVTVKAVCR